MIGKDAILKAIEEGDIEASDLLADFLAEDSDQVTPQSKTQSSTFCQDQAKLTAADKEAAEEAKKEEELKQAAEAKHS